MKTHCKRGHLRTPENLYKSGTCKACNNSLAEEWRKAHPRISRAKNLRHRERYKLETLTHYGKDGRLECCWKGCQISDIDMLTLDHINDDGQEHRNTSGTRRLSGDALYIWARKNSYPDIFQTLCSNHQLKKRIMKDRSSRI